MEGVFTIFAIFMVLNSNFDFVQFKMKVAFIKLFQLNLIGSNNIKCNVDSTEY